jgi:hypothetical protein
MGILDPSQFSAEQQAQLRANDAAAQVWLDDFRALYVWQPPTGKAPH